MPALLQPIADATLLRRIWNEYVEMPGLRLTREQAQRLWGVDAQTCAAALENLVASKFLAHAPNGTYARGAATAEPRARRHMVKAEGGPRQPSRSAG